MNKHYVPSRPQPVGFMPIPVGHGRMFAIEGGPFIAFDRNTAKDAFALCLEARSGNVATASVALDVPDFSTPDPKGLDSALSKMVDALYKGRPAYIGCMAGQGRTGLAMACLAREFGVIEPIKHVRRYYTSHAVETSNQAAFVKDTPLPKTRWRIRINRLRASLPWLWIS